MRRSRAAMSNPTQPRSIKLDGSGTVTPSSENVMLKVGGLVPPTMSVPTRIQSGSRNSSRVQACKSGTNGVPRGTIGLGADSQSKSTASVCTLRNKEAVICGENEWRCEGHLEDDFLVG